MPVNCQMCGACCFSESDAYVPVSEADRARLGKDAGRYVWVDGKDQYLKMQNSCCLALKVQEGRFACMIYDRRPEICRELVRSSPDCRAELVHKKARALRALRG